MISIRARRAKYISFAFLFHVLILVFGLLSPLGLSDSHLTLTRSWADQFIQWDSQWFIDIAKYGYVFPSTIQDTFLQTGNIVPFTPSFRPAAFFPGVPIVIHVLSPVGALIFVNLMFLVCLWLMYRLIEEEHPDLAVAGTILFAINPCAIFFSSLYTETFTVLAVLLIVTGLRKPATGQGYLLSLVGVGLATSVHDLGVFAGIFILRFLRQSMWWRAVGYAVAAVIPPALYEIYLTTHFHTPFALLAAEDSWSRGWRFPFVNIVESITSDALSLNTLFVIGLCALVIFQIIHSVRVDHTWRPAQPNSVLFSLESGLWMAGILLLGLCAYIPGYPLQSVLRFFCVLWPAFIPIFVERGPSSSQTHWLYVLTGSFASYATLGAALFSHGWFFQ